MTYYTVQELTQFYSDRVDTEFDLDESTNAVLQFLIKNIVIPPPEPEMSETNSTFQSKTQDRNYSNRRMGGHQKRNRKDNAVDWETARSTPAFKPTKLENKEGIDKQISEIRGLLNKISTKNYDTQKESIIEKLSSILESDETQGDNANGNKIAAIIFDIASTNKFYSELYALLYSELVQRFPVFNDVLSGFIEKYMSSLDKIHYVDHNVDYDGFCNYTKTNDLRKAGAAFIINLMKKELLTADSVYKIIVDIQGLIGKYIEENNRVNEVDEIVENMYIFITQSREQLSTYPGWTNNIMGFVKNIAGMKSKDKKSLSSRAIFKCMDTICV